MSKQFLFLLIQGCNFSQSCAAAATFVSAFCFNISTKNNICWQEASSILSPFCYWTSFLHNSVTICQSYQPSWVIIKWGWCFKDILFGSASEGEDFLYCDYIMTEALQCNTKDYYLKEKLILLTAVIQDLFSCYIWFNSLFRHRLFLKLDITRLVFLNLDKFKICGLQLPCWLEISGSWSPYIS